MRHIAKAALPSYFIDVPVGETSQQGAGHFYPVFIQERDKSLPRLALEESTEGDRGHVDGGGYFRHGYLILIMLDDVFKYQLHALHVFGDGAMGVIGHTYRPDIGGRPYPLQHTEEKQQAVAATRCTHFFQGGLYLIGGIAREADALPDGEQAVGSVFPLVEEGEAGLQQGGVELHEDALAVVVRLTAFGLVYPAVGQVGRYPHHFARGEGFDEVARHAITGAFQDMAYLNLGMKMQGDFITIILNGPAIAEGGAALFLYLFKL